MQQCALSNDLIRVGAIFPLVGVVSTVFVGVAFFGDTVGQLTVAAVCWIGALLLAIVVLSLPGAGREAENPTEEQNSEKRED